MSEVTFHFENGKDMKFDYNEDLGASSQENQPVSVTLKKKKNKNKNKNKNKKLKSGEQEKNRFLLGDVSLADPDADYPQSRVIKLNPNGELVVESLDDEFPPPEDDRDALQLNAQKLIKLSPKPDLILFRYEDEVAFWNELTDEQKLNILRISYDEINKHFKDSAKVWCSHLNDRADQHPAADCDHDADCETCERDLVYIYDELRKEMEPYLDYLIEDAWFMQPSGAEITFFNPKDSPLPSLLYDGFAAQLLAKIISKGTRNRLNVDLSSLPLVEESDPEYLVSDWEHKAFLDHKRLVCRNHSVIEGGVVDYDYFDCGMCLKCFPGEPNHTVGTINSSLLEGILLKAERVQTVKLAKSSRAFSRYKFRQDYIREMNPHDRFQYAFSKLQEMLPSHPYKSFEKSLPKIKEGLLYFYAIDENISPVHELDTALWLLRGDLEPSLAIENILTGEEDFQSYVNRNDEELRKMQLASGNSETGAENTSQFERYIGHREKDLSLWPEQLRSQVRSLQHIAKDPHEQPQEIREEKAAELEGDVFSESEEHEPCENGCNHEHDSSYSDEELSGEEVTGLEELQSERFCELLGLFFIQSTQLVRRRFLDAYNKKNSEDRTQKFIEELQAEEDAKKEKVLKKRLQKEKQKELRLAQKKLREEERKRKEEEELEKARIKEKEKEQLRAEQKRQQELIRLKKEEEKAKKIEALKIKKANMAATQNKPGLDERHSSPKTLKKPAEHPPSHSEEKVERSVPIETTLDAPLLTTAEKSTSESLDAESASNSDQEVQDILSKIPTHVPESKSFDNPPSQAFQLEQFQARNHLLDQLYHVRPKSVSLSPDRSPMLMKNMTISGSPALGFNSSEHRLTPGLNSDIWLPMRSSLPSDLPACDTNFMASKIGPNHSLQNWMQPNSFFSDATIPAPAPSETRSRSIWAPELSPSRPSWGLQTMNSPNAPNASIWNSLQASRPMLNQPSLTDNSVQPIGAAAENAMRHLSTAGSAPAGVAPTLQLFLTTKSILGTPALALSEFLRSLSSSPRFELLYDDMGSVSHVKIKSMGVFSERPPQPLFSGPSPGPFDAQMHSVMPQNSMNMNLHSGGDAQMMGNVLNNGQSIRLGVPQTGLANVPQAAPDATSTIPRNGIW